MGSQGPTLPVNKAETTKVIVPKRNPNRGQKRIHQNEERRLVKIHQAREWGRNHRTLFDQNRRVSYGWDDAEELSP